MSKSQSAVASFRLCVARTLFAILAACAAATPAQAVVNGNITFTSNRDGNNEIYVMAPDGTGLTNLTTNPAQDFISVWSPDGSKIAFSSTRDGTQQIYKMNADGSNVVRLTNHDSSESPPPMKAAAQGPRTAAMRSIIRGGTPGA